MMNADVVFKRMLLNAWMSRSGMEGAERHTYDRAVEHLNDHGYINLPQLVACVKVLPPSDMLKYI
jgi:hypothetical protein